MYFGLPYECQLLERYELMCCVYLEFPGRIILLLIDRK